MSQRAEDKASNDPSTLMDIYLRHAGWFRTVVAHRYGSQDVDDLVQEAWLRLAPYQSRQTIRHPKALLLRIASNLAADRFNRRSKRRRLADDVSSLDGWGFESPSQTHEVLAQQLVLGLPQPLRDVFVLSRVGGLSNNQVAEQLGISLKTVEWRMTKALAHCASQLRR